MRVKGSPDRSVSIADIAGAGTIHGKGSGDVPEVPAGDTGGCVGRLGSETFAAPQLITQAAHVKVDRETGVVRVLKVAAAHDSGVILNRMGADGQVTGGVVMGVGLALSEGTVFDDDGRQRNPHLLDYKLVTCSDAPGDRGRLGADPDGERGPARLQGRRRAPAGPDRRRDRERDRQGARAARPAAPDDARAGLGRVRRGRVVTRTFTTAATVEDALEALGSGARPIAGGTDLVVGARQGKAPLPEAIVAIDRIATLEGIVEGDDGLRLGALVTHEEIVANDVIRERFTALADASAIVGSHATRAHGTIGGNVMNASPAMDTGGPLLCFDASARLRSASGEREVRSTSSGPDRERPRVDPRELLVGIDVPAPTPATGSAYVRLEYRRQMEIAVVGVTAVVASTAGRSQTRVWRSRRWHRRSAVSRRRRRRSPVPTAAPTRSRPPPEPWRPAPRRSRTSGGRPGTARRWRR